LRKAAIVFGILIALVFAGLILAPQLVELNRFKDRIAAELSARTGHTVELVGPIGLSLLPGPVVTARDVHLANPPGAAVKDMVRLRALEVKLAVWPLLTGHIEVRSATLIEPEIDLERLPDGATNWRLDTGAPTAPGARPAAAPGTAKFAVAIDHLAIQNGAVTYRSGPTIERFEHINGRLTLESLGGPFDGAFTLVARGAELGIEARSGRLDAAEVPLRLAVTTKPAAQFELDGALTGSADNRRFAGKLKFTAENAQAALGTLARLPLPAALAQPLALSGDLTGSRDDIRLEHLAVDLGAAHGEGSLRVNTRAPLDLAVKLSVNRLDVDRWLAARKAALTPGQWWGASAFAAVPDAAPIPPAKRPRHAAITLPTGIKASLELGVDAMLWRSGLIRDARLQLALADGRLTLDHLTALLPGGADVSLRGSGDLDPDGAHAKGVLEANADDLRGLLRWLGIAADRVPADRLRRASLTTRFTLDGERLDLAAADATLDTTSLSGAATVLLRARPGIGLRLAADRFNLDAYLPQSADPASPPAATAPASPDATAALPFDANLDARVQQLTWRGQPLGDVHLAGTLQDGEATIRELSVGDAGGASGKLSGVLEGIGGGVPKGQFAFDLRGPEFERLLRLVSPKLAVGRLYGAFSLGGGMQAEEGGNISLDADLQVLDGHAHISGELAPVAAKADLDFDADHPSLARLLRSFYPSYRPGGGDPGALKLAGHVKRQGERLTISPLSLAIGASTLDGTLGVTLGGTRPLIAADLTIGDWAIDRLLPARETAMIDHGLRHAGLMPGVVLAQAGTAPRAAGSAWSTAPFDFSAFDLADVDLRLSGKSLAYGVWRAEQPTITATLKDKVLSLQRFAGRLFGGSLEASGALDAAVEPKLTLKLALGNADLKAALADAAGFHLAAGRFDVAANLAATGASPAELVAHLVGDGTLAARDGSLSGLSLKTIDDRLGATNPPADLLGLVRGTGGETAFSTLAGSFHVADGVAHSNDLHLVAEGGEGSATANVDLPRWTMASRIEFHLTGVANAPPLVMRLDGPLDAPRTVFEVNALEQFLAQRAPETKPPARP
jgi:uncharacterized protein involved in outer membrane biogenesis